MNIKKTYNELEELMNKQRRTFAQSGHPRSRFAIHNILANKTKKLGLKLKQILEE